MKFDPRKPFRLPLLPPSFEVDKRIGALQLKIRSELGELNGYSRSLPNPQLLLSPAVIRESVASSRIENINTTLEQALQTNLFPEDQQTNPDKEVLQYRAAVEWGFNELEKVPVSTRLILGVHKRLLPGQRPGFRRLPAAIVNSTTGEILYTPPRADEVPALLANWENYLHTEDGVDPILKCAIGHYQFEAIHPFGDGNGRVGRILMVLYLIEQKFLSQPILYISGYINDHRSEYYKLLRGVSESGEWHEFVHFMLKGFHAQARQTKEVVYQLVELLESTRERIRMKEPRIYSSDLVQAIFAEPVLTPVRLGTILGVHYTTATRYLNALTTLGILEDRFVGKYHQYVNRKLIDLLEDTGK